ncbi:cyclic nucleotide-binding domain-containing protein [Bdellovibrio sp. 22V]|uniref:cyclic nucleotide-binding domain-containing protein n=1 Tax=Bdellovibrio TaxID=958 RepID=UPI0025434884|nr:cyclic nucleotide-binding domain-containing protein [Bdellovibrio sp. 22V]WII72452.1 cyclic nucleotide-binding domain-containing protein [Bdellovibrio sp. 22V]
MGLEKKNTFLIVSGDKTRIQRCTDVLSRNIPNCSVFHSAEWFETKYKLDNVHPKAILIDEYLPKGSGFDVVSKILKEKNNDDIFIIIMSYVADHDLFSSEVASGRVQFLTEPDREQALMECISKIVSPKKDSNQAQYELKQLQPGEVLFKEGDSTEIAYIVKKGSLRAYCSGHDGDKVMLGEIMAGEFVGEMGHFNHDPRSATVEAITEVELIAIPHASLDNVIFTRPSWAKALVKTLSQRLKKANKALTG